MATPLVLHNQMESGLRATRLSSEEREALNFDFLYPPIVSSHPVVSYSDRDHEPGNASWFSGPATIYGDKLGSENYSNASQQTHGVIAS